MGATREIVSGISATEISSGSFRTAINPGQNHDRVRQFVGISGRKGLPSIVLKSVVVIALSLAKAQPVGSSGDDRRLAQDGYEGLKIAFTDGDGSTVLQWTHPLQYVLIVQTHLNLLFSDAVIYDGVEFAEGTTVDDAIFTRVDVDEGGQDDLQITFTNATGSVTILETLSSSGSSYKHQVEFFEFKERTVLSFDDLNIV